jgi:hypothetical protein
MDSNQFSVWVNVLDPVSLPALSVLFNAPNTAWAEQAAAFAVGVHCRIGTATYLSRLKVDTLWFSSLFTHVAMPTSGR